MWKSIGRWAVKVAVFALEHKSEIIAVVDDVQKAKRK